MTKRKKIIIIVSSVLAAAALITGLVFAILHFTKQQDPIFTMSGSDFLTSFDSWQAEDERIIWHFNSDGTGTLTTNAHKDDYSFTWSLEKSILHITTAWHYMIEDTFSFTTNREEQTFTIFDKAEEKLTTFHPINSEDSKE